MECLQYIGIICDSKDRELETVLNLVISGMPSIPCIADSVSTLTLSVLNLVISGMPSIL